MPIKSPAKKTAYLFAALILVLFPATVIATMNVTLAWDPNTEPNLAGYRLYVREAGEAGYFYPAEWQGTQPTCTIEGLDRHESYYFVVRAVDTEGNESGDSNEVFLAAGYEGGRGTDAGSGVAAGGSGGGSGGGCFLTSLLGP